MSAERPEVGDVWQDEKGIKYHLFGQIGSYFDMVKFYRRRNSIDLFSHKIDVTTWKYIGKSKTNINELFEVKDD